MFDPVYLGRHTLANSVIMAPMTRLRATGGMPNELMAHYYAQRATAGLIVTECTAVHPTSGAYIGAPGIFADAHALAWQSVTRSVREAGGKVFLQLWHGGRIGHPSLIPGGELPLAPSPIAGEAELHTPAGKEPVPVPQEMSQAQIAETVEAFGAAARRARQSGFDGIEIHGAFGYLIEQFLADSSNQRNDSYGGSVKNRLRFLHEVLDAVLPVFPGAVGVKLSPCNTAHGIEESDREGLFRALLDSLMERELAYLHVMRALEHDRGRPGLLDDPIAFARERWRGALIANGLYEPWEAQAAVTAGDCDAVSFGRLFIANPTLPEKLRIGAELAEPDFSTVYAVPSVDPARGYVDY